MHHTSSIEIIRVPGLVSYADAYELQIERRDAVLDGLQPEAAFFLEHKPTITLGREAKREHLLTSQAQLQAEGIEVHEADRGGDITYHGPGQLVVYPILNLNQRGMAIRAYLRAIEDILVDTLAEYGIKSGRVYGMTGVWVDGAKVAAIGVGARRWVTCHGLALNIDPDMSHFTHIVPCGIADKPVTSLRAILGKAPDFEEVLARLQRHFLARFDVPTGQQSPH